LLATGAGKRFPGLPDVPTIAETVAPDVEVMAWMGIGAPKGTPQPIVQRLNKELHRIIALPQVEERLRDMGGTASPSSPEEMRKRVVTQIADWKAAIEAAGIEKR
jgi:tripartite-type tricarboxylate transporter receptor subunit TctC